MLAKFCMTAQGQLPPMAAFIGGFIAQEAIKAITNKYTPIQGFFYTDAIEVIPDLPPYAEFDSKWKDAIAKLDFTVKKDRTDAIKILVGQ